jgi:hypothetical protein
MANCFWDDYEGHRKLHLANWHMILYEKGLWGIRHTSDKRFKSMLIGIMGHEVCAG